MNRTAIYVPRSYQVDRETSVYLTHFFNFDGRWSIKDSSTWLIKFVYTWVITIPGMTMLYATLVFPKITHKITKITYLVGKYIGENDSWHLSKYLLHLRFISWALLFNHFLDGKFNGIYFIEAHKNQSKFIFLTKIQTNLENLSDDWLLSSIVKLFSFLEQWKHILFCVF